MSGQTTIYIRMLGALLLVWGAAAYGSDDYSSSNYARGAAGYLGTPLYAHAAALSGACVAWSNELTGLQYNPAILDAVDTTSYYLGATYGFLTLDRKQFGADLAAGLGSYLVCGLSYGGYTVGEMEGRDERGNPTTDFRFTGNAIGLSIAGRLKWGIALGIRARYLFEEMADERANGVGFDVGATWQPREMFRVGVSVQNLLSKLWWSTGSADPVLMTARIGAAGLFFDTTLIVELDVVKSLYQDLGVLLGIQYELLDIVFFRAGLATDIDIADTDYRDPDFSLGIGMRYKFLGFDYSLTIPSSDLGLRHMVSLIVKIPSFIR